MRGDQLVSGDNIKTLNVNYNKVGKGNLSNRRVDINDLLSRAREDERKQKKENLVFFGVIASLIAVTGIIASL